MKWDDTFAYLQRIALRVAKEQRIRWDIKQPHNVIMDTFKNDFLTFLN
jgi:hypothetical protein